MAERSNTEIVRAALDAYNDRDADAFCRCSHAHVRLHPPLGPVEGRAYSGHDGVRHWMRDVEESSDEARLEADQLTDIDSRVLMLGRFVIHGRTSEANLASDFGLVCEVADGRITLWRGFLSHVEAIRAAEML